MLNVLIVEIGPLITMRHVAPMWRVSTVEVSGSFHMIDVSSAVQVLAITMGIAVQCGHSQTTDARCAGIPEIYLSLNAGPAGPLLPIAIIDAALHGDGVERIKSLKLSRKVGTGEAVKVRSLKGIRDLLSAAETAYARTTVQAVEVY